jgi:hypothetical protein
MIEVLNIIREFANQQDFVVRLLRIVKDHFFFVDFVAFH